MPAPTPRKPEDLPDDVHGHTGPTTPAEDSARKASPSDVPPADRAKIAEEAARQEDA